MSVLKYKKRDGFLNNIYSYLLKSDEVVVILSLSLVSLVFFLGISSTLKIAIPLLFFISVYISKILKNSFIGFFLVSLYTFQFFTPNKYYQVEVLRSYEIRDILTFQFGRIIGYGINLSNVFLTLSTVFMISEVIRKKRKNIITFLKSPVLKDILLGLAFIISGVNSAFLYSPYHLLSIVWTFQYAQVFIVAFLTFYYFKNHKGKFKLFYTLICFNIFLQFIISSIQFLKQSSVGLPIEATVQKQFFYGLDEISNIYRVAGTFFYHNELALITMIYMTLLFPRAIAEKKVLYFVSLIAAFATLIMTQSRANWIGFSLLIISIFKFFYNDIKNILRNYSFRRLIIYLGILLSIFSFLVIPRILLSFNAPLEGAGIPLRKRMIEEGFEAFIVNPLFGYGAGTNEYVLHSFFPEGVIADFPLPVLQAHLQFVLEFGIIGALLFVLPFYQLIRKVLIFTITRNGFISKYKIPLFTFILGLLTINIHYVFQNHYGIIEFPYIGLILGFGMIAAYSLR